LNISRSNTDAALTPLKLIAAQRAETGPSSLKRQLSGSLTGNLNVRNEGAKPSFV